MVRRLILLSAHRNSWHYYLYSIVVEMNSPEADRAMMGLRGSRRNPNLIAKESDTRGSFSDTEKDYDESESEEEMYNEGEGDENVGDHAQASSEAASVVSEKILGGYDFKRRCKPANTSYCAQEAPRPKAE
jgi:hypothetical protein